MRPAWVAACVKSYAPRGFFRSTAKKPELMIWTGVWSAVPALKTAQPKRSPCRPGSVAPPILFRPGSRVRTQPSAAAIEADILISHRRGAEFAENDIFKFAVKKSRLNNRDDSSDFPSQEITTEKIFAPSAPLQ